MLPIRHAGIRSAVRAATSSAETTQGPPEGWLSNTNDFLPYHKDFNALQYGKHAKPASRSGEESWQSGPFPQAAPSHHGYLGNIQTPNWLLGENGDEIFAKCQEMFKPFEHSRKKIVGNYRMRLVPGKATAGPPIGPTFSEQGSRSIDFVKAFNDTTAGVFKADPDLHLKTYLRFYDDKTYQWRLMPPTTSWLIRRASRVPKGTGAFGASAGVTMEGAITGFVTLQQLYHVAALANSWGIYPDRVPLELRVMNLITSSWTQGIAVMGVHCRLPPRLGMSDEEQLQWVREEAAKWAEKQTLNLDENPLERTPWMTTVRNPAVHDFKHEKVVDAKTLIKDAQSIDQAFQKMIEKKEDNPDDATDIFWEHWKKTGVLLRNKSAPTAIETRHIEAAKSANIKQLLRAHPSTIAKVKQHQSTMWHTDSWEQYHSNMFEGMGTKIR
eukprot:TRINITY_DN57660_c0_g1_i1.p1 TRINITY_DN57660_c0_g1~~TRINITY_DN57660_c0_g1_i1.p1  ORF type:complete len:452 (+),score=94.83 TRINITY_DN57660_c0_g1_i1:37-1356(+)